VEAATDLDQLARRYVWWQPSSTTLARRDYLLCQIMQLATAEDVEMARRVYGDAAFRDALRAAPAGVLDARSWTFWHRFWFDRDPPALPSRPLP